MPAGSPSWAPRAIARCCSCSNLPIQPVPEREKSRPGACMAKVSRQAGLLVGKRVTPAALTRASGKEALEAVQHRAVSSRFSRVRACDGLGRAELGAAHDEEACVRLGHYRGVVHRPLPHRVPPPGVAGPQGCETHRGENLPAACPRSRSRTGCRAVPRSQPGSPPARLPHPQIEEGSAAASSSSGPARRSSEGLEGGNRVPELGRDGLLRPGSGLSQSLRCWSQGS
jgi:hypothetical protein